MGQVETLTKKAFEKSRIGSVAELENVAGSEDSDILSVANSMTLRFQKALHWAAEPAVINNLFEVGMLFGSYPVVKNLQADRISQSEYEYFLKHKAVPYVPMYRDGNKFKIDDKMLGDIIKELGGKEALGYIEGAVLEMRRAGSRNLVKQLLLAYHSGNEGLRKEVEKDMKNVPRRGSLESLIREHCAMQGYKFRGLLQAGDADRYYPVASNLFLATADGDAVVLKENLKLNVDYSRFNGYTMEKEIYQLGLSHPSMLKMKKSFLLDGHEFLELPFVDGENLKRYTRTSSRLSESESFDIAIQLADVLSHLHNNGIVYMDVKDKNVLLKGGRATLIDFGMAQILGKRTYAHSLLSTPRYVAPEMGLRFRACPETDTFQLGILLYELLYHEHPFATQGFREGDSYRESEIVKYALPNCLSQWQPKGKYDGFFSQVFEKDPAKRPDMFWAKKELARLRGDILG